MSDLYDPAGQAYNEFRKEQEEKKRIEEICEGAIRNAKVGVQTSLVEVPAVIDVIMYGGMDDDLKDELFLRSIEADMANNQIIADNVNAEIRKNGKISAIAYHNVLAKFQADIDMRENSQGRIKRALAKRKDKPVDKGANNSN